MNCVVLRLCLKCFTKMDKVVRSLKLMWSKTNRFHRVLLLLVLVESKLVPSGRTGFYCNDPALSYPFTGDTILIKWLLSFCAIVPLIVMLMVERKSDRENGRKIALKWYKEYMFVYIANLCFVQILKFAVGSPRPHFFDTCKPVEAQTCTGSEYVPNYTCIYSQWHWSSDKSFPSGHTSLSIYGGLFIAYYLQRRLSKHNKLTRACQVLSILLAVWCAISRMTDHRHHWWDVLAGLVIGVAALIYTALHLCGNFQCEKEESRRPLADTDSKSNLNLTVNSSVT